MVQPITGTILSEEQLRLKKLIFRVSRGNAYVQFFDLNEKLYDYSGQLIHLVIYFVIYPTTSLFMKDRLIKVCESFSNSTNGKGERYELPSMKEEIVHKLNGAKLNIQGLYSTLRFTIDHFKSYLTEI